MAALFSPIDEDEAAALARAAAQLGCAVDEVRVVKRSLDARKGYAIGYRIEFERRAVDAVPSARNFPDERVRAGAKVIVVGTGPAGTFATERLLESGAHVTLVDMGKPVQPRRHDLAQLTRGQLNPDSNYCFGEGGAGTFSDGKLYTRTKDKDGVMRVLRSLQRHGAAPSITIDSRPHIGSNKLPKLLTTQREYLESLGATYFWDEQVVDLVMAGARVVGVRTHNGRELIADAVVLAVGHSARRMYELLHSRDVALQPKAFALGARVEHPQPTINRMQYGRFADHPKLPNAFYQLAAQVSTTNAGDRGVYSFCMCPGGWLVDSATEAGRLCTNGMSLSRRDSPWANSALVVTVEPRDYLDASSHVLSGIAFQRAIEARAYELGGGNFVAAAQRLPDYLANKPTTAAVESSYRPSVRGGDVRGALPAFVGEALARAVEKFSRTLPGFGAADAHLVGVETRSSSPVRILRGENFESPSHPGLYPAGEGAGYAGGIVSAALDGYRAAGALVQKLGV